MNLIWKAPDPSPLPKAAVEAGLRTLAERAGLSVPDDATVILEAEFVLGSYPVCLGIARDGSTAWFVDYEALRVVLLEMVDAELRKAGVDPQDADQERQVYRILRRRFIHWPEEQVEELRDVIFSLEHLITEGHEPGDDQMG